MKTVLFAFILVCVSAIADNVTNLYVGQPLYVGMPLTTVPSATVSNTVVGYVRQTNFNFGATTSPTLASVNMNGGNYLLASISLYYSSGVATCSGFSANGTAMTLLGVTNSPTTNISTYVYGLANPTTGDLVATVIATPVKSVFSCLLFSNATTISATSIAPYVSSTYGCTNTISATTNDIVVDFVGHTSSTDARPGPSSRETWKSGYTQGAGSLAVSITNPATPGTITTSWTNATANKAFMNIVLTLH